MPLHVTVSVELPEETTLSQREQFQVGMESRRWRALDASMTWETQFQEPSGTGPALSMTESDVAAAASAAGIIRYKAVARAGGTESFEFGA